MTFQQKIFLQSTILILSFYGYSQVTDSDALMSGTVRYDLENQVAQVDITYTIHSSTSNTSFLNFLFSKKNEIIQLNSERPLEYHIDTTSTRIGMLTLNFSNHIPEGAKVSFDMIYEVQLDSISIEEGFSELGLDWFWFPVHPKLNNWHLQFDLMVKTGNPDYLLFSNGTVKLDTNGIYSVQSKLADFDVNLFLFKEPSIAKSPNGQVKVVGPKGRKIFKDSVITEIEGVLAFYENLYGKAPANLTVVFRPVLESGENFGYYRKGFFVLPQPRNLKDIRNSIAHELAHFWFLHGEPNENNWLNESFAEYNAMLYIEDLEGANSYNNLLNEKKERIASVKQQGEVVPEIYGSGNKNKTRFTHVALYHKGPILLDKLRMEIGEIKFKTLMNLMSSKKISTTDDFVTVLQEVTDECTAKKYLTMLKNF